MPTAKGALHPCTPTSGYSRRSASSGGRCPLPPEETKGCSRRGGDRESALRQRRPDTTAAHITCGYTVHPVRGLHTQACPTQQCKRVHYSGGWIVADRGSVGEKRRAGSGSGSGCAVWHSTRSRLSQRSGSPPRLNFSAVPRYRLLVGSSGKI